MKLSVRGVRGVFSIIYIQLYGNFCMDSSASVHDWLRVTIDYIFLSLEGDFSDALMFGGL